MTTIKIMARMNMPSAMRSLRCIRAFGCLESEDWHPWRPTSRTESPRRLLYAFGARTLLLCLRTGCRCENSGAHGVPRPTFARLVGGISARHQTYGLGCGAAGLDCGWGGVPGFACSPGFGGAAPAGAPPGISASAEIASRSDSVNELG